MLHPQQAEQCVRIALAEDSGCGDLTSEGLLREQRQQRLALCTREAGVVCGLALAKEAFLQCDPHAHWHAYVSDGQAVAADTSIAYVESQTLALLRAERVALNFLQHLSGIATLTQTYVKTANKGAPHVRIYDTRKTIPGLRTLAKYAVTVGGGHNHRFSLSDGILIKDNHLAMLSAQGIPFLKAVQQLRQNIPEGMRIQIEVENLQDLEQAIDAGADALLLDNMTVDMLKKAVQIINKRAFIEASGGIRLHNIAQIAASGVDAISIGALTQSAPALDIAADWVAGNHPLSAPA